MAAVLGHAAGRPGGTGSIRFDTRSGLRVTCSDSPIAYAPVWEVFCFDDYGLRRLARAGDGPRVAVDIGAHVGSFALALCARDPAWQVVCFEPSPTAAGYLRRNVEANGLAGRIRSVEAAVAGHAGPMTLWQHGPADCSTSAQRWTAPPGGPAALRALAQATPLAVRAVSLEEALGEVPGGAAVDLLKIDCEGAEYDIVLRSPNALWARVRAVLLEYHPVPGHSWDMLDARLASLGFRRWWSEPGRLGVPGLGIAAYTRAAGG